MSLSDYTTEELREELRKRTGSKTQYTYAFGKVIDDQHNCSLIFRKCYIEFSDSQVAVHKLHSKKWRIPLLGGAFNSSTAPKVGDIVKIRSRITKERPTFSLGHSKICDIVKQ